MGGQADRRWHLIVEPLGQSGEHNMAADEGLLDEAMRSGNSFLRLYQWDPPTLSIGRNQPNIFHRVRVVRRPTGGQAVWHEHEVTYAVAAPISGFGSLRNAYCEIHTRIARALRKLGVDAVLAAAHPPTRPSAHPSCFATPVGGEILVGGRKLVGSAQVRRRDAFLQHGSILLAGSQQKVAAATGETTLNAVLGRAVTFDEITTAIIENWDASPSPRSSQAIGPSDGRSVASIAPA